MTAARGFECDLIYDIGLNVGQDAEFYLNKGFRVVGIEANPTIAAQARLRLNRFADDRLIILTIGIGPRQETRSFYVNRTHHEQSTFVREYADRGHLGFDEIVVPVTTIDTILDTYGVPYYMKVDIEAWDMVVLRQLAELDARPKYISVETGPKTDWVDALEGLGYGGFKLVNQSQNANISLTPPAKEGLYVVHTFEPGSSGPFGDEIEGSWVSADLLREQWQQHVFANFPDGDWFDIHARFGPQQGDPSRS